MSEITKRAGDAHVALQALEDAAHRAAAEHLQALDALREEVRALRTINAGLRERLAVLESKPVEAKREVVRGDYQGWPLLGRTDGRHAVRFSARVWSLYRNDNDDCVRITRDESEAIAWVLDGVLPAS